VARPKDGKDAKDRKDGKDIKDGVGARKDKGRAGARRFAALAAMDGDKKNDQQEPFRFLTQAGELAPGWGTLSLPVTWHRTNHPPR
jgi:hypothetical protein